MGSVKVWFLMVIICCMRCLDVIGSRVDKIEFVKVGKIHKQSMLMYLGCVPLEEGNFVVKKYTTEIHGHVSACVHAGSFLIESILPKYPVHGRVPSLYTEKKLSDQKYTTKMQSTRPCTWLVYFWKVHYQGTRPCT